MRLTSPDRNESRSVSATTDNKRALRRWAMQITMDNGKAPYEPLQFAVNLKPDAIFLLSDGEFPSGIEELLSRKNRVENLFGEKQLISIVHNDQLSQRSRRVEDATNRAAERGPIPPCAKTVRPRR